MPLIVYCLSRLARNTREIGECLAECGAALVCPSEKIDTTSAAGKMVFRMLAVLAEFERDQVSERTKLAEEGYTTTSGAPMTKSTVLQP